MCSSKDKSLYWNEDSFLKCFYQFASFYKLDISSLSILSSSVTSVQQWRTKVFHFLTYHKAGKKKNHFTMMFVARPLHPGRCLGVSPQSWLHFSVTVCLNLRFLYLFICIFVVFIWVHYFLLVIPFLMSGTSVFCCFVSSIKCWLCPCFEDCLFLMYVCVCSSLNLFLLLAIVVFAFNMRWRLQCQTGMWMIQCWDVAPHQLFELFEKLWCTYQIWPTLSLYLTSKAITNDELCWYFGVTQKRMFF